MGKKFQGTVFDHEAFETNGHIRMNGTSSIELVALPANEERSRPPVPVAPLSTPSLSWRGGRAELRPLRHEAAAAAKMERKQSDPITWSRQLVAARRGEARRRDATRPRAVLYVSVCVCSMCPCVCVSACPRVCVRVPCRGVAFLNRESENWGPYPYYVIWLC